MVIGAGVDSEVLLANSTVGATVEFCGPDVVCACALRIKFPKKVNIVFV
jgi:hypothetical protein